MKMFNNNFKFSETLAKSVQRTRFKRPFRLKTSFNVGELVPLMVDEVLPGDTFKISVKTLTRLQALLTPVMDNAFLDVYAFFVPSRLCWDNWKKFQGEAEPEEWEETTELTIPQYYVSGNTAFDTFKYVNSFWDHMGIPCKTKVGQSLTFSRLPINAFALIYNYYFRDENLITSTNVNKTNVTLNVTSNQIPNWNVNALNNNCRLPKVAKFHDYFTSALPKAQKGEPVSAQVIQGLVPVVTGEQRLVSGTSPLTFANVSGSFLDTGSYPLRLNKFYPGDNPSLMVIGPEGTEALPPADENASYYVPNNLYASFNEGEGLNYVDINSLRLAFQTQRMLEQFARTGTRYSEILNGMFGVRAPDASLQNPQYIGGTRTAINIQQVVQTSATGDGTTPLANVAGYSVSFNDDYIGTLDAVEHGYLIIVGCVRTEHTYSQGLERFWSRKLRTDFYMPVFAHLGEQPIKTQEIYQDGSVPPTEYFGFNEAWADYRYKPSRYDSEMRTSLASWHFGDTFTTRPYLSKEFIEETNANVDRTLAVTTEDANQVIMDCFIDMDCIRPMPLYSVPGLIDHF